MRRTTSTRPSLRRQAGFTLLETLIGLGIGLFLLGGIVLVMGMTRQNFNAQNGLSQLQDDERIAVSMLVMVIEHAGFFSTPQTTTIAQAFPTAAPFASAGQSVSGTSGSGSTGDTISVRYLQSPGGAADSDFMQNCNGGNNTDSAPRMSISTFTLNNKGELTCAVGSDPAQPLSAGIRAFSVLYGVDSDNDRSVDRYLPASSMTADLWTQVGSVRMRLDFTNPLDSTKPATVVRVINLMNQS